MTRHEMFMKITKIVAERSTCERAKVGAIAVKDSRIITMGYGGAPARMLHCTQVGCDLGPDGGCIRTIHAEQNVIAYAAKNGISLEKAELYTTLAPCYDCAKLIINSGIVMVFYKEDYRDSRGVDLLENNRIVVGKW